ncbi:DUF4390 domain-containing protein [Delftia sp. PS-11]|uniref:DUF4390 domain-containing protein n=1 Tax=Delftia sp. PS-11 TaxID=2767222 RepID=UPI002455DA58|nr:DUF4390 domain-containing protein [Delftia sp. PS-11]KAJ8746149.1 DUF4390 domain-containing protein [Delftia sp. PS-11]
MIRVTTTASSTLCCKRRADSRPRQRLPAWLRLVACLLLACLLPAIGMRAAQASASPAEISSMQLERGDDGLLLSASLHFELPPQIDDALRQGVPMYFVADAQVHRERWYWSDQQLASASRYFRLSHQPLTRRWRLHVSNTPFSSVGQGLALGQTFEQLEDALASLQRISRWRIMEAPPSQSGISVQLRFRLDLSQLPRPLQIGALGRSSWNLQLSRTQMLESAQ